MVEPDQRGKGNLHDSHKASNRDPGEAKRKGDIRQTKRNERMVTTGKTNPQRQWVGSIDQWSTIVRKRNKERRRNRRRLHAGSIAMGSDYRGERTIICRQFIPEIGALDQAGLRTNRTEYSMLDR